MSTSPHTVWTDTEALAPGLGMVGDIGFLIEIYRPGRGSVYELRTEPLAGREGGPILTGSGQPWNNLHPSAHGLARIVRYGKGTRRVCLHRIDATPRLLEERGYPELAPEAPPPVVAYRATATGQTVSYLGGGDAPEYRLERAGDVLDDIVELPDGTHAYLEDVAGAWGLFRRAVAVRFGGGGGDEEGAYNSRTAPEPLVGIIGEAQEVHPSERKLLRVSYRDLVGWAA